MTKSRQTDNSYFSAKLDLRRYFLRRYHADRPPRVLDCCEGEGRLWAKLRQEIPVASVVGLDVKRRPGRLKIDSARLLARPGWAYDVIDVDTYSSPFRHWLNVMVNMPDRITLFLTWGIVLHGGGMNNIDLTEAGLVGLGSLRRKIPASLLGEISKRCSLPSAFRKCASLDIGVVECIEALPHGNARYIGMRLERKVRR